MPNTSTFEAFPIIQAINSLTAMGGNACTSSNLLDGVLADPQSGGKLVTYFLEWSKDPKNVPKGLSSVIGHVETRLGDSFSSQFLTQLEQYRSNLSTALGNIPPTDIVSYAKNPEAVSVIADYMRNPRANGVDIAVKLASVSAPAAPTAAAQSLVPVSAATQASEPARKSIFRSMDSLKTSLGSAAKFENKGTSILFYGGVAGVLHTIWRIATRSSTAGAEENPSASPEKAPASWTSIALEGTASMAAVIGSLVMANKHLAARS